VEWPAEFYAWQAGDGCPSCAEGRPASTTFGDRYFAGHLHTRIVPRYADDPRPGWPFPFPDPDPPPMPPDRYDADLSALRRALDDGGT